MEFRNLPTDWSKRYIVVGYGIEMDLLREILRGLSEVACDDSIRFYAIIPRNQDAIIEFIPLEG